MAEGTAEAEGVAETPKPGRYVGVYDAVPSYAAQPGTSVLGGARPPPQSRNSQTSPSLGTYQSTLAWAYASVVAVDVQPDRSVLALTSARRESAARVVEERILIV